MTDIDKHIDGMMRHICNSVDLPPEYMDMPSPGADYSLARDVIITLEWQMKQLSAMFADEYQRICAMIEWRAYEMCGPWARILEEARDNGKEDRQY